MGNLSKRDANHVEIRRRLEEVAQVKDVSWNEGFGCDLLALHLTTRVPVFLEIKLPRSRNRLTESELALREMFPGHYVVVTTVAEAYAAVGYKAPPSPA